MQFARQEKASPPAASAPGLSKLQYPPENVIENQNGTKRKAERMRKTIVALSLAALSLAALLPGFRAVSVSAAESPGRPESPVGKKPVVVLNMAADALVNYLRTEKPLADGATPTMIVGALNDMVDQYEDTNVTHLYFNVCYNRAAYRSKAWESYWDDENPESYLRDWPLRYWLIHRQDVDPFAVVIARCREKRISPWVSIRMNDTHYLDDPSRISRLWLEHPEFRTHERGGFDFTHPEVRRHYLAIAEELLQRYDVDGVELDWMRFAHHFKREEARGKCGVLTDFMREVRRLTEQASGERGHPIGVSVRVPARPDFAQGMGMDAVRWVREGLVDILVPCSTWNPSYADVPVETWRKAIGSDAPEYLLAPGTDLWIRGAPGKRFMQSDMETMRGFTTSMLDRGADAIYLFNHFARTDSPIWHRDADGQRRSRNVLGDLMSEAGLLQNSLGKPRRHILTYHDPVPPDSDYQRPMPATIGVDRAATFAIHTGPKPTAGRVLIRAGLDDAPGHLEAKPAVRLNGTVCGRFEDMPKPEGFEPPGHPWHPVLNVAGVAPRVVQFEVPLAAVRRGYNSVELRLTEGEDQRVIWLEMFVSPYD
jgi:hypothetical protein